MQKRKSTQHRFKASKLLVVVLSLVLLFGAAASALELLHVTDFVKSPEKSTPKGPTKKEAEQQARQDAQNKQGFLDKMASQTDSTPATGSSGATLAVSASQSGGSVTVLTQMQNVASGECKLIAMNGEKSTTQTAHVIYESQFSSCAGFSVPTGELGNGAWTIAVEVVPSTGAPLSKSTSLEVK